MAVAKKAAAKSGQPREHLALFLGIPVSSPSCTALFPASLPCHCNNQAERNHVFLPQRCCESMYCSKHCMTGVRNNLRCGPSDIISFHSEGAMQTFRLRPALAVVPPAQQPSALPPCPPTRRGRVKLRARESFLIEHHARRPVMH